MQNAEAEQKNPSEPWTRYDDRYRQSRDGGPGHLSPGVHGTRGRGALGGPVLADQANQGPWNEAEKHWEWEQGSPEMPATVASGL